MNRSTYFLITAALLSTFHSAEAYTPWRLVLGSKQIFDAQTFNLQPVNIPTVDSYGNTPYLDSSLSATTQLLLIDDTSYADRSTYSTWFSPQFFVGLQAPISSQWLFRLQGIYVSRAQQILNQRTMIYTPQTQTSTPTDTTNSCLLGPCSLPSIMPHTTETMSIISNAHPEFTFSFLYRYSDYFQAGILINQTQSNYSLTLDNTTPTTFTPSITEWGIESLFRISEHTQLSTSIVLSQSNSYIQRLLNFQVTASSSTPTTYALSYIPIESNTPWQACTGYMIDGSTCDNTTSAASTMIDNYYYNDQTPSTYGTSVSANNIQNSIGPQVWWARYHFRASLALEWAQNLDILLPRNLR